MKIKLKVFQITGNYKLLGGGVKLGLYRTSGRKNKKLLNKLSGKIIGRITGGWI